MSVAESDDDEIFCENTVQSAEESNPRFDPDAVGRLNVMVSPEPVMVKSVPLVDVAKVVVGPSDVWFRGPMAVMADVKYEPAACGPRVEVATDSHLDVPVLYLRTEPYPKVVVETSPIIPS